MLKSIAYRLGRLYGQLPTPARAIVVGMLLLACVWVLLPSGGPPGSETHGAALPQSSTKTALVTAITPEQEADERKRREQEAEVDRDHLDAKHVCQKFALKQLKAPATAQFEPLETVAAVPSKDKKWEKMKDVWDSMGWVDSQNSFGALIRSEYMCTIQKAPDGRWKLLDLNWLKNSP